MNSVASNFYLPENQRRLEVVNVLNCTTIGPLLFSIRHLVLTRIVTQSWGHCHTGFYQESLINHVRRQLSLGKALTQNDFRIMTEAAASVHTDATIFKGSNRFLRSLLHDNEEKKSDKKNDERKRDAKQTAKADAPTGNKSPANKPP